MSWDIIILLTSRGEDRAYFRAGLNSTEQELTSTIMNLLCFPLMSRYIVCIVICGLGIDIFPTVMMKIHTKFKFEKTSSKNPRTMSHPNWPTYSSEEV